MELLTNDVREITRKKSDAELVGKVTLHILTREARVRTAAGADKA